MTRLAYAKRFRFRFHALSRLGLFDGYTKRCGGPDRLALFEVAERSAGAPLDGLGRARSGGCRRVELPGPAPAADSDPIMRRLKCAMDPIAAVGLETGGAHARAPRSADALDRGRRRRRRWLERGCP